MYLIYVLILFMLVNNFQPLQSRNYSSNKHTQKVVGLQQKEKKILDAHYTETLAHFKQQPQYTRASFKCFLRHTYNNPNYAQKFLSVNFSHVVTFLSYASKTDTPRAYINSIISLFSQKLKSTYYANAYSFMEFLDQSIPLLAEYFDKEEEKSSRLESIKYLLTDFLEQDFENLKQDPEQALNNISEKIYKELFKESLITDLSIDKLQQSMEQFFEIILSKLIWSPYEQKKVWDSFKSISNNLFLLSKNDIIVDQVLDSLLWTLLTRFAYFLEIAGAEINLDCYSYINKEINSGTFMLNQVKEREPYITSKMDFLKSTIMQAEAKARAYQAGIIADRIEE